MRRAHNAFSQPRQWSGTVQHRGLAQLAKKKHPHRRKLLEEWATGDIDAHDIAVAADGRVIFVCTLFGCLATLSERASFQPLWRPPFLSALVPEDRCHLNGLALRDGWPAYVTAVADCDVADGWRDRRREGDCAIDVASGEIVARGYRCPIRRAGIATGCGW